VSADRDTGDRYTHGHHDAVLRSHRWRTAENSAGHLLPHLTAGQRLLDVGCGPGTITVDLAARVAPGEVVGIDVAPEVVEQARAHAAAAGQGNVTFAAGDFRTAGLAPASFDVVHAHQVLQHLRDPVGALRAMAALARPGGLVAVRDSDYAGFVWAPADERLDRWLDLYLAVTQRNGAEANAGRWLLRWAHEAGLREVAYTTSTWTFATAEDRAWWGGLWAERCTATTFAAQAVEYGLATPDDLASMAAGWRDWAIEPDGVFVVLHGELLTRV
jgi:ubiquinone/menaquinone biosynthesis C-methylase UbiE